MRKLSKNFFMAWLVVWLATLSAVAGPSWVSTGAAGSGAAGTWHAICTGAGLANTWHPITACNRVSASIVISANTQNYVLNTAKVSGYVAGITDVQVTINSGVFVGATSTALSAFSVDGSWAAGDTVTVINNGVIAGAGGAGGAAGASAGGAGAMGGTGLAVGRATKVVNNGTISGGGGGGGAGGSDHSFLYPCNSPYPQTIVFGGGGGGGGAGYVAGAGGAGYNGYGSAGSAGSTTTPGAGGVDNQVSGYAQGGAGGYPGAAGAAGQAGLNFSPCTVTTALIAGGAGGAPGHAVVGNVNVTWVSTGTLQGTLN